MLMQAFRSALFLPRSARSALACRSERSAFGKRAAGADVTQPKQIGVELEMKKKLRGG